MYAQVHVIHAICFVYYFICVAVIVQYRWVSVIG